MSTALAKRINPGALVSDYVDVSLTGAKFKKGMPAEDFVDFMRNATRVERAIQLVIGDGINYAEGEYGEEAWQYIEQAGVKEGAVNNWAWVARSVPEKNRVPGLDFTHYREVAKMEDKQKQGELLKMAAANGMGYRELHTLVKTEERLAAVRKGKKAPAEGEAYKLIRGRVRDIGEDEIPGDVADMVFANPPNADKEVDIYEEAAAFAARVLKPSGVFVIFAHQENLSDAIRLATPFLTFVWVLAVERAKSAKGAKKVTSNWQPALVFVKGESLPNPITDTITQTVGDEAIAPALQILDMFTLNGETVIDPYIGDGAIFLEALRNGRKAVGIAANKSEQEYVQRLISEEPGAAADAEPEGETATVEEPKKSRKRTKKASEETIDVIPESAE